MLFTRGTTYIAYFTNFKSTPLSSNFNGSLLRTKLLYVHLVSSQATFILSRLRTPSIRSFLYQSANKITLLVHCLLFLHSSIKKVIFQYVLWISSTCCSSCFDRFIIVRFARHFRNDFLIRDFTSWINNKY